MAIAMEDQCPPFKQQAWKELRFPVCVSGSLSDNLVKYVFSRSVKILAFNAGFDTTVSFSTTLQLALHSCTLSQTAFGSLTLSVGGALTGNFLAGAVTETDLSATDSLVVGMVTKMAGTRANILCSVIVRYKET